MPASKKTQEFVEKELPYKMLMYLYEDSRAPLKALGRKFNISYHTISEVLKKYEEKYRLAYTLELDEQALGFTAGRLISVKFASMPNIEKLKERLVKDVFVQDAYLGSGDFDLLLYVVGLTDKDFDSWQFKFRIDFSDYKPNLRFALLNQYLVGFFPLRNDFLSDTTKLNSNEKKVLLLLNENSRMKLNELVQNSKLTQMRVIYIIKKLKEKGIIKKFTTLVQQPDKRLFSAYACYNIPVKWHEKLLLNFLEEMTKENFHEIANDYNIMANTNGFCDLFFMCAFSDGEVAAKRGPEILKELWKDEDAKVEKVILTSLLVGKWPFHLEKYQRQQDGIAMLKKKFA